VDRVGHIVTHEPATKCGHTTVDVDDRPVEWQIPVKAAVLCGGDDVRHDRVWELFVCFGYLDTVRAVAVVELFGVVE